MRWLDSLLGRSYGRSGRGQSASGQSTTRLRLEPLEGREMLDATPNELYLAKALRDLLRREPDPAAITRFADALNRGASRTTVALAIQSTPEYRQLVVQSLFEQLLRREPSRHELVGLVGFLAGGGTIEQIGIFVTGGNEYYQSAGGGTDAGFLDALYRDVLGRPIDGGSREILLQMLASGTPRWQVARIVYFSEEYRLNLVQSYYVTFLLRSGDPLGLTTFVSALGRGARAEQVIAVFIASEEYVGALTNPELNLTVEEVGTLLRRAAAASPSDDGIIAILDRGGRVLGVRVEGGVSPTILNDPALLTFAIDGAIAKARTGAFFGNNQAPLTSRTIQQISQTTMTQREIESNPNILDVNDPRRGPGFVAPIGIKGHFPADIPQTPQVDLFAIEHTNRDSINHPGFNGVRENSATAGGGDDLRLRSRFNIDPTFIPAGKELTPPESYGLLSNVFPRGQGRGIGTLPGGIPITKLPDPTRPIAPDNLPQVVGGIGVFYPGQTGFASEENSRLNVNYDPNRPDRSLEAEFVAFAAVGGSFNAQAQIGELGGIARLPQFDLLTARIDLVGITLELFGPGGIEGPANLVEFGKRLGMGTGNPDSGFNAPLLDPSLRLPGPDGVLYTSDDVFRDPVSGQIDIQFGNGNEQPVLGPDLIAGTADDNLRPGVSIPSGFLVVPHDGLGITAEEVARIIQQGITQADATRAAIRILESTTRMVFAVTDTTGEVLGLFRMPDSTIFSIDVAVAKARNAAYYADATALQAVDQIAGVPVGTAFTARTFRYAALPRFPEGIDGMPPGPFSILNDGAVDPLTGLNVGPPLPSTAFQSVQGFDAFNVGRNFRDPANLANQNGIVFFPGSAPLYKDVPGAGRPLVGGFGVSGDGVDQDDVVTFSGALGFNPGTDVLRADQTTVRGVRLPYQKFNRKPQFG